MNTSPRALATARWRDIFAAFERIVSLEPDLQAAALADIARDSPDLYPRLLTLLHADRAADSANFLNAPPLERMQVTGSAALSDVSDLAGQTVGPYRFIKSLGTGGMGQVWLAERADGRFAGLSAIKLLRSFGDEITAQRFEREGQLLGRLQHPNIARLLDAGAMDNAQLYLVLEYVEGDRIDRAFDEQRLSIRERIGKFLPVCDAIVHAHSNLIVHRDLKPSNILLARDGSVKVLDFGIAKLLEERAQSAEQAELTQLSGRAFTPEFAAPEQVRGEAISTVTDVYALGVLLYRLLSGSAPYSAKSGEVISGAAYMRRLLESDARLMSESVASDRLIATTSALARQTSPLKLVETLAGDLDVIVAKAIKLAPEERYQSVAELREDLVRYLEFKPIAARTDSKLYRLRKFVRRHRIGVAASVALAASVVAGVWGTLSQAILANERAQIAQTNASRAQQFEQAARVEAQRATRGESEAKAQTERAAKSELDAVVAADSARANELLAKEQRSAADRFRLRAEAEAQKARSGALLAQKEAAKALSVKDFVVELFNTGDINVPDAQARELKVATTRLLNRGTERLLTQLADQPEVRSELIDTVANLHLSIESPEQAERLYREQLAVAEKTKGARSREAAASWVNIGRALRNQRLYADAERAQLEAIAIYDALGDKSAEPRGRAQLELVQMSFWTNTAVNQRALLEPRARESIAIFERYPKSASAGEAWYGLGRLHEASGENESAALAYERGVNLQASVLGERHATVAGGRQMRARVLGFDGRFDEAYLELRRAQKLFEETVGVEHRFSVDVRAEIAEQLHQLGESIEAIKLFRAALAEQTKLRGEEHSSTGRTRRLLAEALYDTGQLEEAKQIALEALRVTRRTPTSSPLFQARLLSLVGRVSASVGELAEARSALAEAEKVWRVHKENYGSGVTALDFALLYEMEGSSVLAQAEIDKAVSLLAGMRGKLRNDFWRARIAQANVELRNRRMDALTNLLNEFKREAQHIYFPRVHAQILQALASAEVLSLRFNDACRTLTTALPMREKLDGTDSRSVAQLRVRTAEICSKTPR